MKLPQGFLDEMFSLPFGSDDTANAPLVERLVVKYRGQVTAAEVGFITSVYGSCGKEKTLMALEASEMPDGVEKWQMMRHLFGRQH